MNLNVEKKKESARKLLDEARRVEVTNDTSIEEQTFIQLNIVKLGSEQMFVLSEFLSHIPGVKSKDGNVNFNLNQLERAHRVCLLHYVRKCLDKNAKNEKRKKKEHDKKTQPKSGGESVSSQ